MNRYKIFLGFLLIMSLCRVSGQNQYNASGAEKLGWRLASQAYTFKKFNFVETLEMLNRLDIQYIEMYRKQEIGGGYKGITHYNMNAKTRTHIKELLARHNIKVVNFGVVHAADETEWRQIFDFAKALGIETLTAEPDSGHLDMMEALAEEYQINVALHNHPVPSYYWHPEIVKRHLDGRSKRLGVCADIGHWTRSGIDPVQALKILKGRIITCHIKDLNAFGITEAHDLPWGTGVSNISGVLHELRQQNFKGVFTIEYEYNWENSSPEIQESIHYFNRVAHWLSAEY